MSTQALPDWFHALPKAPESESIDCLKSALLETPLGTMLAIGNDKGLYLLQFIDKPSLQHEVEQLKKATKSTIIQGSTPPILSIESELKAYFKGQNKVFNTPLLYFGTAFQQQAWNALRQIPYGVTKSYAQQACDIGKPSACRAVANANGANHLCIVIPCHRIITSTGEIGGYSAGIDRKKWLLQHER